jgi:hypothetical protein
MPRTQRLTKADAIAFLLTHIVVERARSFEMNPLNLFHIMHMADTAVEQATQQESSIPHEIMEAIAKRFIQNLSP